MDGEYIMMLQKGLSMPEEKAMELAAAGAVITLKKSEAWISQGDPADHLALIIQGAMRSYIITEKGEEMNMLLLVSRDFTGDYEGFITSGKAGFHIRALINTELFVISRSAIDALEKADVFWTRFKTTMSDYAFIEAKRRIEDLLLHTPEQRYLNLLGKSREILQKIPQKYISTYLGITPQSLSRIRKRISK
ncbi:CRP-like cAMP-binding protein [Chryseobacterium sp. SORGH_AS909]|uniref:CRP-like cAMP-binding protein n=2 Tax=Chryseobacterium camelliae TaxID=1265445 RepID=A0ABU0TGG7_9FLAO|nr:MULTISPECIES: Crp/Fnr family transcriptional regulator [unclassified Chryseobacterium]MDQ1096148.1 CRP-like cAMP-binding protein [Chryseobacterium camelliae]MDQ1100084.1 CRP-like cAMP-binding protein [Chryseobacterium sp. SORGH_AS_1048]MDR6087428.1 CRP-like cAMP-binding protein [Chryseobacterium sp. SORGH_AS_0909]MDR6131802.1 CRP-like cAMP-binding protein [Chryseobacterium sp. SORGH_AS_1175]